MLSSVKAELPQAARLPPLVSIALATYNGERFIAHQLDSIINQTYPNIEIIISDDGSTDNTYKILMGYARRHHYFTVYKNSAERGVRSNFENALKHCNGSYIALCDQDDLWMPDKIELLVNEIGDASLIYHDSLLINEKGESLHTHTVKKHYAGNDPRVFLLKNVVSGHACLFKKELLRVALPFPTVMYPDWWLGTVAADQQGVRFCHKVLVHYRQHLNNTSDFTGKRLNKMERSGYESHMEEILRFEHFKRLKKHPSFFHEWYQLNLNKSDQWFCFRLFQICFKNRKTLYYLFNKSSASVFFRCLGFLWGFMLKKLVDCKYDFDRPESFILESLSDNPLQRVSVSSPS